MNDSRFRQLKYTVKAGLDSYPSVENMDNLVLVFLPVKTISDKYPDNFIPY